MRRVALASCVLLALAACGLGTEGAPCRGDQNCAEGLACGGSGTCTRAAAACADRQARPLCKVGAQRCVQGDAVLEECGADERGEECASFQPVQTCTSHQSCGPRPGGGALACNCSAGTCGATRQEYCDPGSGQLVTCQEEAATGCWFAASQAGCGSGTHCADDGSMASCVCDTTACVDGSSTFCQANNERVVCKQNPTTLCWAPDPPASCGSVKACTTHATGATCDCPTTRCTLTSSTFCDPGGGIITCRDVEGCLVEQPTAGCGDFRECTGPTGSVACTCVPEGGCATGIPSLCDGQGKEIACLIDNGCRHPAAQSTPCSTVHQTCRASAGTAGSCQCVDDRCADGRRSFCDATGKIVTCSADAALCPFEGAPATCDPGRSCVSLPTTPATAECQCPAADTIAGAGCTPGASPICGGSSVLECRQAPGSTCFVWTAGTDCTTSQLTCSAGGCVCPAVTDGVYYADAVGGTASPPPGGAPAPTGAESPAGCRYSSIEVALAQANGVALGGGEVRATGAIAPMTFAVAGSLAIGPGVTVTTTDAPLGIANYTLQAAAGLGTQPFVTLGAGATLSGFHLQNGGSTGPAVASNCATGATAPATVDTVKISGAGSFSAGVLHASSDCAVTVRATDVSGVGRGVDLLVGTLSVEGGAFSGNGTHVRADPGPTRTVSLSVRNASLTHASDSAVVLNDVGVTSAVHLEGNTIALNQSTTGYLVSSAPAITRRAGGLVLFGSIPNSLFLRQNVFEANGGDQVLVFVSGSVNLSGGPDSSACGATANILRCYDASPWVGLYATSGSSVAAQFNSWQNLPVSAGARDFFGPVTGTNQSCNPVPATCP